MSALSFTSPLLLWALMALPVLWFLLRATPPSPQQQTFPPFLILQRLQSTVQTPQHTPWWLLLLRLAAAALIITGLAGPVLNATKPSEKNGPLLIVLDDGWAAAQNWNKRVDLLVEEADRAAIARRPVFLFRSTASTDENAAEPLSGTQLKQIAGRLEPSAQSGWHDGLLEFIDRVIGLDTSQADVEIKWLSDGLARQDDLLLANALASRGSLSIHHAAETPLLKLYAEESRADQLSFRVDRLGFRNNAELTAVAVARDGREIARSDFAFENGSSSAMFNIDLPIALRNEVALVRVENVRSAGVTWLADTRDRRAVVGIVTSAEQARSQLLSGAHYIGEALKPYAEVTPGSLDALLKENISVVIFDDIGRLRESQRIALRSFVENGGVLIRFAGPVLAEAAQSGTPELMPVELRGGGRNLGGALTWEEPKRLAPFTDGSPFFGLAPPSDALVRQQVLAEPGGETSARSWAALEDGTPLVTGMQLGAGAIVLFHTAATPDWSDLPISHIFPEMLRRAIMLSDIRAESSNRDDAKLAPIKLLTGSGRLSAPQSDTLALTANEIDQGVARGRAPGLYGSLDAPFALNAVNAETPFEMLKLSGAALTGYDSKPPASLKPPLFTVALLLIMADALLALAIAGRLRSSANIAAAITVSIVLAGAAGNGHAQPLDQSIDEAAASAALTTRLAYVITGDPATDRLSAQALAALSRELTRRTAIEPGPPAGVDLDADDLSVYPFLYWPMTAGSDFISDDALANIENFMRFGGLVLFDSRDDERATRPGSTTESRALASILSQLNIPPLAEVTGDHVLARSFYLLEDLPGRSNVNPVWVEAGASGSNDGVTAFIIGGRDWAGAWAADQFGRPLRPMASSGPRGREFAYRAGVNIIMVALTGNYKSDQVHTPILLQRLGQ